MMLKKYFFVLSVLLLFFLLSEPAQCELVAWYKLNGNGQDSSGNGFHGTEQNGPLTYVKGIDGQAVSLNGTNQYIVTQVTSAVLGIDGAKPKTVCAWVNNGSASNTGAVWDVSSTTNRTGQGQTFSLRGNNTVNSWMVQLWSIDENPTGMVDAVGTWTHIAFVYDGTTLTVYSDGKQVFSGAKALALGTENAFRLGQFYDPGGTTYYFNGIIDDVKVYNTALSESEVNAAMKSAPEGAASEPNPENGETDVLKNAILRWKSGIYADTHNVFFGNYLNDVNEATIGNPLGVTVSAGQATDVNYFNPGSLEFGKTYYWRVDEVNAPSKPGTFKGQVWQFTVEPVALKVPAANIKATAKHSAANNDPNNTINEKGFKDANNPDWHDISLGMWLSGKTEVNNPAWIMYEFSELYKIHEMFVWNHNAKIGTGKSGFKSTIIEYSEDGQAWTQLTTTQFNRAPGRIDYVYNTTVPFNGAVAKYVRLTAINNWNGDQNGAGLSEVRFTYIPVRAGRPSPDTGSVNVPVNKILTWRAGRESVIHNLYISTSESAAANRSAAVNQTTVSNFSPSLNLGCTYYWRVDEVNNSMIPSLWEDGIWSFSTVEYISIEDFEDYNDDSGYEIWATWKDGFNIPTNGSMMGNNYPPYAEKTIVQHGKQSAPISYDNTGTVKPAATYSEVTRTYATVLNLKVSGADTLRLYYRGRTGPFTISGNSVAMSGTGSDFYTTTEEHRFAYKVLTGNGSITVRIDSMDGGGTYAKAGIMIRSGLESGAPLTSLFREKIGTAYFRSRITQGGGLNNAATGGTLTGATMPRWLKLTRAGNTITAETSVDGIMWVPFSGTTPVTESITMASQVCIGMFISANSTTVPAGALFSNVATTGTITGDWILVNIGGEQTIAPDNTLDTLYISLTDSSGMTTSVKAPELAVFSLGWTEWLIPYSEFNVVDMAKIKKIAIGVGNASNPMRGQGKVFIDNIGFGHSLE